MNAFLESQIPEPIGELDPVAYWRLDEFSNFPTTLNEWNLVSRLPSRPRAKLVGEHSYDIVVNRKARRPVELTVRRLLAEFQEDFSSASDLFEPVHWRFLFYLDLYPMAALGNPSFDARQAFQQIYDQHPSFVDVPSPWTGSSETAEAMLCDIRARISDTTQDVAKAAYVILTFARSLGLEKHDVLQVPWWQIWWIKCCVAACR